MQIPVECKRLSVPWLFQTRLMLAALLFKNGGLPISYECRKRKNELKCLLTLPLARRITPVHIVDQVIEIKTSLHLKCLYFAAMWFPSVLTHPSSPKKRKNIRIHSNQSVLTSTSWKTLFSSSLFRFNATFWVALPQVTSITCYPIQRVVTFSVDCLRKDSKIGKKSRWSNWSPLW